MPEPRLIPFGTFLKPEYSNGLVGHWKMNVNSGLMLPDLSGYNKHGTLTNMASPPTATSGHAGNQGLRFDGSNDYVKLPQVASTLPFSVFAWIYVNVNPIIDNGNGVFYQGTLSSYTGTHLLTNSPNSILSLRWNGGQYYNSNANAWTNKVWSHVGVTIDVAGNSTFWSNGRAWGTAAVTPATLPAYNAYIGTWYDGSADRSFNGLIADVRIYNRALSADEVAHSYYQQEEEWDLGLDEDLALDNPVPIIAYQERLRRR